MKNQGTAFTVVGFGLLVLCGSAGAQGRGEGAIVLTDNVPIYSSSDGNRQVATAMKGDEVAGQASVLAEQYYFSEKDGRVQVIYYPNVEQVGLSRRGWMDPAQLSVFSYDCSCGEDQGCSPTRLRGLRAKITMSSEWNTCFKEARDAHRKALAEKVADEATSGANSGTPIVTKTVQLEQTIEEVESILGTPGKILNAGSKVIYIYSDLKVTFVDGRVADLE